MLFGEASDEEWAETRTEVFKRDDYTCQRCGHQSGPHAGDEGRTLHPHHIQHRADGGDDSLENLATLCRPCHATMHPSNETFDAVRGEADLLPMPHADDRVSVVNSGIEGESLIELLERNGHYCTRCWDSPGVENLYLTPIATGSMSELHNPLESFTPLCSACLSRITVTDSVSVSQLEALVIPYAEPRSSPDLEEIVSGDSVGPLLSRHPASKLQMSRRSAETATQQLVFLSGLHLVYAYLFYTLFLMTQRQEYHNAFLRG